MFKMTQMRTISFTFAGTVCHSPDKLQFKVSYFSTLFYLYSFSSTPNIPRSHHRTATVEEKRNSSSRWWQRVYRSTSSTTERNHAAKVYYLEDLYRVEYFIKNKKKNAENKWLLLFVKMLRKLPVHRRDIVAMHIYILFTTFPFQNVNIHTASLSRR